MAVSLDHAVYAVRDLDAAAERWRETYGLEALPGGVHPTWGTGNRIVPLGQTYLELLAVIDPRVGAASGLGRTLMDLTADGDRWFALCVRDDDIEATGQRLGLPVVPGSRTLPDGSVLAWRGAGLEDAARTRDLPFFIAWDAEPELHPGRTPVQHPAGADGIAWVEVAGDAQRFSDWTGGADLPVRFVVGGPALLAVAVRTPANLLAIR